MGNAERTEPLTLIGPRGLERVVNALRMIAPELPFELRMIELTENRQQLTAGLISLMHIRLTTMFSAMGIRFAFPEKAVLM